MAEEEKGKSDRKMSFAFPSCRPPPLIPLSFSNAPTKPQSQAGMMAPKPPHNLPAPPPIKISSVRTTWDALEPQSRSLSASFPLKETIRHILHVIGDLGTIIEHWKGGEWIFQHRIVEFSRNQVGSTVHVDFKAVSEEQLNSQNASIRCLWWKEKGECYVLTSEVLHLAEFLFNETLSLQLHGEFYRTLERFKPLKVTDRLSPIDEIRACIDFLATHASAGLITC